MQMNVQATKNKWEQCWGSKRTRSQLLKEMVTLAGGPWWPQGEVVGVQ